MRRSGVRSPSAPPVPFRASARPAPPPISPRLDSRKRHRRPGAARRRGPIPPWSDGRHRTGAASPGRPGSRRPPPCIADPAATHRSRLFMGELAQALVEGAIVEAMLVRQPGVLLLDRAEDRPPYGGAFKVAVGEHASARSAARRLASSLKGGCAGDRTTAGQRGRRIAGRKLPLLSPTSRAIMRLSRSFWRMRRSLCAAASTVRLCISSGSRSRSKSSRS
jgi:hypothetical protein